MHTSDLVVLLRLISGVSQTGEVYQDRLCDSARQTEIRSTGQGASGRSEWAQTQPLHLRCREFATVQPKLQRDRPAAFCRRCTHRCEAPNKVDDSSV
jgi:hypothetical protein